MTSRSQVSLASLAVLWSLVAAGAAAQEKPVGLPGDPALKLPRIGLQADPAVAPLVPWPMRGRVDRTFIALPPSARVVATRPELLPLAQILTNEIMRLTRRLLPVAQGAAGPGDIALKINPRLAFADDPYLKINPALHGLEQRIEVSAKGLVAEGVNYQAAAMASVTLLQALQGAGDQLRLPAMLIEDKPGAQYFGMMLDVARQWHPIEYLYEVVDLCRLYKMAYLHFHFTDDQGYRLPSRAFPKAPSPGASYSDRELRDFVAYADRHGVTVVPEIEMPGHSGALQGALPEVFGAKNPATGKYDTLGVLNIANEECYAALDQLIGEACGIFKSSPYFHIGADETQFGGFYAHPAVKERLAQLKAQGVKTEHLFASFINRVNAIVKKYGKKTIAWEGFGGNEPVDKDVIIMAWHGQSFAPEGLMKAGFTIINVPWTPAISWSARQNYEWNLWLLNRNEQSQSQQFEITPQVLGGQMVFWEKGPTDAIPTLRDKVCARQERMYSPWSGRSFEDYYARFAHTDDLLEKLLYPAEVKLAGLINTAENLYSDQPVQVAMTTPLAGAKIYYTINGPNPTPQSGTLYTQPFAIEPKQAGLVFVNGYYGPRAELRVRVFGPNDQPLGGSKWIELRCEAPRLAYKLYEAAPGVKFAAMPDPAGLKLVAAGKLARLESSGKLARNLGAALVLEATGRIEALADGEYQIGVSGANVQFFLAGRLMTPAGGRATVNLPVGMHAVRVLQYANDGNVGAALMIEKAPPDPPNSGRRFTHASACQWMPALPN